MIQGGMNLIASKEQRRKDRAINAAALMVLCAIGALTVFGPSGVVAWSENSAKLEAHEARIAVLVAERDTLTNRKDLLSPDNVDPDYASELVRKHLGVAHPDEYITTLD